MSLLDEVQARLQGIPTLQVTRNQSLAQLARFGTGGPADIFAAATDRRAFIAAARVAQSCRLPWTLIGGGTNLVISDQGFRGVVLRFDAAWIECQNNRVYVEAGASLQRLVDFGIAHGLGGLQTLTGIPGTVGGAIYGNAGAYGHSIQETVCQVEYFDGEQIRTLPNTECGFQYRESTFKQNKRWMILAAELELTPADSAELARRAADIMEIRNRKYPPEMRCAGSFFKNCFYGQLPPHTQAEVPAELVRDGKVPSAWFLEQVGAKGRQLGGIHIAAHHANTPYNAGGGTSFEVLSLIADLKRLVRERFGFQLEEEVQYVGFDYQR